MSVGEKMPWDRVAGRICPRRRADVCDQRMDGESVLFDPVAKCTFHLNVTALAIWSCCDGSTPLEGIARSLAERYDIDIDRAMSDVEEMVATFAEAGLLEDGAADAPIPDQAT